MGGGGDDGGMAIAVLDGGPSDGQRVAVPDFADQRMPPQRILVDGHVYWRKSLPKARLDPDEPWGLLLGRRRSRRSERPSLARRLTPFSLSGVIRDHVPEVSPAWLTEPATQRG